MATSDLRRSLPIITKFVAIYAKLFKGLTLEQIAPRETSETFWLNLFTLDVDIAFLSDAVNGLSKNDCLGRLKPLLNTLFSTCLLYARTASYEDSRKSNAIVTLSVIMRWLLKKNLSGWEVMEIAGGVSKSDKVFMELVSVIDDIMGDDEAPGHVRHQALQLAVVCVSGITQLSPGAYFLRRDLFSAIVSIIKSPTTEQFAFEASLLLALLANFHKSDAGNLNPYFKHIRDCGDKELMRIICWAANFAVEAAVKAYQSLSDDSLPTLTQNMGYLLSIFRPDRVLADAPRDLFKDQPIEAAVIVLPIFEFLNVNSTFPSVLLELLSADSNAGDRARTLPLTLITLASYVLTHATSSTSPRAVAYANVFLNMLLRLVDDGDVMAEFCKPSNQEVRICRQRIPHLPLPPKARPLVCDVLDCCVLWLRHNLHKSLETYCYLICIRICCQITYSLQKQRARLEYHWQELWRAILGVLEFLSKQLDSLHTTGGVEALVQEIVILLDVSLTKAEAFLPSSLALHEFIYELVRNSAVIKAQRPLLHSLALPDPTQRRSVYTKAVTVRLSNLISVVGYYEDKLGSSISSAKQGMRAIGYEVDKDGIFGVTDYPDIVQSGKTHVDSIPLLRFAYVDATSLMP